MGALVRLQRYHRHLEPWRQNLKIDSELFIETELVVKGKYVSLWYNGEWQKSGRCYSGHCYHMRTQWYSAYVIDIKQIGNFEKEIKVEFEYFVHFGRNSFWKRKVYQSEWIVIGSKQIRCRNCNDPYLRFDDYPDDTPLPLLYDEDSVSKNICSRRLKSREKQIANRSHRFKDQREMGLKYKRKMKLKAAEIRKKEKAKTKNRSRSRLRK